MDNVQELRLQAYSAIVEQYQHHLKGGDAASMTAFELAVGMIVEVTETAITVVEHKDDAAGKRSNAD